MTPYLVILAGGISSRMKEPGDAGLDLSLARDADEKAKSMIRLGESGRPFLDYLLANGSAAGYREVVIVVGEGDRSIRGHYGDGAQGARFQRMRLSYAVQPVPPGRTRPLGTADALLHALLARPDWADKKITVCNSDNLYSVRAMKILLEAPEACALIDYDRDALGFASGRVAQYAVIRKDRAGFVQAILEKPAPAAIAGLAGAGGRIGVSMNIYRLSPNLILPYLRRVPLDPERQEKELPTAVTMLASDFPGLVKAYELAEEVPDLTQKSDIRRVRDYVRERPGEPPGRVR